MISKSVALQSAFQIGQIGQLGSRTFTSTWTSPVRIRVYDRRPFLDRTLTAAKRWLTGVTTPASRSSRWT